MSHNHSVDLSDTENLPPASLIRVQRILEELKIPSEVHQIPALIGQAPPPMLMVKLPRFIYQETPGGIVQQDIPPFLFDIIVYGNPSPLTPEAPVHIIQFVARLALDEEHLSVIGDIIHGWNSNRVLGRVTPCGPHGVSIDYSAIVSRCDDTMIRDHIMCWIQIVHDFSTGLPVPEGTCETVRQRPFTLQ